MDLGGFLQSKIRDFQNMVAQRAQSPIVSPVPQAQTMPQAQQPNFLQQIGNGIGQQVNYALHGQNIFGQQQPFSAGNPFAPAPRLNIANKININTGNPITSAIATTGARTLAGIPESVLNAPSDLQKAIPQDFNDIRTGQIKNPGTAIRDVAQTTLPIATLGTLGGGTLAKGIAENVGSQAGWTGFGKAIISGAKQGAGYGGIFGILQGLAGSNQIPQQVLGAVQQGLAGAGVGAALGGITGGTGNVIGKVQNSLEGILRNKYGATPQQATQAVSQFARDELGRFTTGGAAPKKEPIFYGDLRESLGLPRQGNYQQGFVKVPGLGEEGTLPIKQGDKLSIKQELFQPPLPPKMSSKAIAEGVETPRTGRDISVSTQAQQRFKAKNPLPWETPEYLASQKEIDKNVAKTFPNVSIEQAKEQFANKPPTDEPIPGTASIDPQKVAEEARLARSGAVQSIQFKANTIAERMNQVLKGDQDNLNIRLAIENPKKLDYYAKQSRDPEAFKAIAKQYSDFTDSVVKNANESGDKLGFINDYFTHIWDLSTPEARQTYQDLMAKNAKNFTSGFTKERVVDSIQQGLASGLHLKNKLASQDVVQYAKSIGTQIGASAFNKRINELRPNGAVPFKNSGTVPYNYKGQLFEQSNVPGNKGTFIDPEIQKHLGFYNPSVFADNKIVKVADKTNAFFKAWDLALGGFHGLKTTARALSTDPRIIPEALRTAADPVYRAKFDQKAVSDGVIDFGTKVGVTFSGSGDLNTGGGLLEKINSKNPIEIANKALFGGLINTYKINAVRNMMSKFDLADPKQFQEAKDLGAQINNLFGGLNYEALGRNKTVQQILRFGVLASDFNEGKLRQIATSANLTNWSPAALYARKSLLGEALVFAVVAELGRRLVTGKFDDNVKDFVNHAILNPGVPLPNSPLFNNNKKTQIAYTPSSDIGDIYRAVTDPGQFVQARGAMLPKLAAQLVSGKDYYGRDLVPTTEDDNLLNRAKAIAGTNLPIPVVQGMKVAQGKETPADAALNTLGVRVANNPDDSIVKSQQQFSDGIKQAQSGLRNPNDLAVFNSLHPQTKDQYGNSLYEKNAFTTPEKAATLLNPQNINVLQAEIKFQKSLPNHDPMWDLQPQQLAMVLASEANLPGQSNQFKKLLPTMPWYLDFQQARSQFYASLPPSTTNKSGGTQRPAASPYVQQQLNAKNYADPQVQAFFKANDNYNNAQLTAAGLPPVAGTGLGGSGGYSSAQKSFIKRQLRYTSKPKTRKMKIAKIVRGKKLASKSIKVPKLSIANPKTKKLKLA